MREGAGSIGKVQAAFVGYEETPRAGSDPWCLSCVKPGLFICFVHPQCFTRPLSTASLDQGGPRKLSRKNREKRLVYNVLETSNY